MLKSSFVVVLVSLALICIVKKNTAVVNNTIGQPENSADMKPYVVIPIRNLQESISSIHSNTENTAVENETNVQPKNSDIVIQIDNSNESGTSHPNTESNFEPFEVVASERYAPTQSPILYKLPSDFIKVNEKWQLASEPEYSLVTPLCPEYEPITYINTSTFLATITALYPDMEKCLFVKYFKANEMKRCLKEPKLVVIGIKDNVGLPAVCGIQGHQRLVEAQYYNCGSENDLMSYAHEVTTSKPRENLPYVVNRYTMYQICYDFESHQTLWTKHSPLTPALIANQQSPYKKLSNEFKIEDFDDNASFLDLADSIFRSLKNSYQKTDSNETKVFTMVPKDHMALHYWKKATTHMINSAPLSPKFIPLLKAINNGILQATIKLFAKSKKTLEIYTKAETRVKTMMDLVTNISYVKLLVTSLNPINLFQSNIWYHFVYDKGEKSGILIVLHNTQQVLPEHLACNDVKRISCEFKTWSDSDFDDTLLDYAYCCRVSQNEIQHLFSIGEIDIQKTLDIQEIIKPTQKMTLENEIMLRNL